MGLVGRLEDLPITDILQIVFLSRGTGVLKLRLAEGNHSIVFRKGLAVNAASPAAPSLRADLANRLNLAPLDLITHEHDIPVGVAALEMNLLTPGDLETIVSERVIGIIRRLSGVSEGEFEFIAGEPSVAEMEYDPRMVFRKGGLPPEMILEKDSLRLRTLGNVKESLNAVATQRTTLPPSQTQPGSTPPEHSILYVGTDRTIQDALQHAGHQRQYALLNPELDDSARLAGTLAAERRSFAAIIDFGSAGTLSSVTQIVRQIKSSDSGIAVIAIDDASRSEQRHRSLEAGADLYVVKPDRSNGSEVSLFVEDLMMVASRRFTAPKGAATIAEPGPGEAMDRGFRLLVQLIKEVSDPNDITPVTLTILQLAADYFDRSVLFAVKGEALLTLGKFGLHNSGNFQLHRGELSIVDRVIAGGHSFRGNLEAAPAAELSATFSGKKVREAVVVPILSGKEVLGVLYGDNAVHQQPIADTAGLEMFLAQAGFAFHSFLQEPAQSFDDEFASGPLQFA